MLTPPNSDLNPDFPFDLLQRMTRRLQQAKADDQLLELLQQVFDKELEHENIVLSRQEKKRLFRQAAKAVLTDMLAKVEHDN